MKHKGMSFESLLNRWERSYGSKAVPQLLAIARKRKMKDTHRYIALMGSARLGGQGGAPMLVPFLKDPSWMIRSGALRALSALGTNDPKVTHHVIPKLYDKALIVRAAAVDTVVELHPKSAIAELLKTLHAKNNYHKGLAQWVPQKSLRAISFLADQEQLTPPARLQIAQQLRFLLKKKHDKMLINETLLALERITGQKDISKLPDTKKIQAWEARLKTGP